MRQLLGEEPEHPLALGWLALCRAEAGELTEARELAKRAVGVAPDLPYVHYLYARVLLSCGRLDEAEEAADRFIVIDPSDPDGYGLLGLIRSQRRNWKGALSASQQGLALDPDHGLSQNVHAMALVRTGDSDRAVDTMEGALRSRPDDAFTHANQGWTLLHKGLPREAEQHFREALRLDPDHEWAREGVLEALKARNGLYRLFLRYKLWMDGLTSGRRMMVIFAGFLVYRVALSVMDSAPQLAPILWALVIAYVAFCILTWFGDPIFDFLLLIHPFGRHALRRREKVGAAAICGALVAGVAILAWGWFSDSSVLMLSGVYTFLFAAPLSVIFQIENRRVARLMSGFAAGLLVIGAVAIYSQKEAMTSAAELRPLVERGIELEERRDRVKAPGATPAERESFERANAEFTAEADEADLRGRLQKLRDRRGSTETLALVYPLLCVFGSQLLAGYLVSRASRV